MQDIPVRPRARVSACASDDASVRAALRGIGSTPAWTYLGARADRAERLARRFGPTAHNMVAAPLIQAAAEQLRQPFIDYVGALGRPNETSAWWRRSCVVEKNPYVSSLFFHVCCLRAVERMLETVATREPFLAVVDSYPLRLALARHLGATIYEPWWASAAVWARGFAEILYRQATFLLSSAERIIHARYLRRLHRAPAVRAAIARREPICAAHVWVDQRAYDPATGEFTDLDFADVRAYLEGIGKRTFTVPHVLQSASHARVVKYIARSPQACLLPHAFLTLSDVWRAAAAALASVPRRMDCQAFAGMDVSVLIAHDLRRDWFRQRQTLHVLLERLVARWKRDGLRIERYIYPFENHIWERVLCETLRRLYPEIRLIGYQPNGLPLFLMNYFIANEERGTVALPDLIVTTGRYATQVLTEAGYERERIALGGGLRQRYLQTSASAESGPASDSSRSARHVLVTTPIGPQKSVDLIAKCAEAFADVPELRMTIKCHPSMPFALVEKDLPGIRQSARIDVTTASLRELLPEADVIVYNGGFPCAEALASGVPVVYVEPEYGLSLDALDGFPALRVTARTPAEIRQAVLRLLNLSPDERARARHQWRQAAQQLIGLVDTDTLALFAQ